MGFRINTNVAALSAHANASMNNRAIDNSLGRLNSGFRINSAADDASGMAIADSLRSQASSLGKAIMNANDAIGIVQTADKAMDEQIKILDTIKEKAIQSAQDGQTTETRKALQADISRLMEELDNIGNTTSFNGQKLLSGTFSNKEFQIGAYSNETVKASIGPTTSDKIGLTRFETGHNVRASDLTSFANFTFKNVDGINDVTFEPVQLVNDSGDIKAGMGLGALAEAINKASDKTGVKASVTVQSVFEQPIKAGSTTAGFSINGVMIGAIDVKEKDGNGALRSAINSVKDQTGVEASVDSKGRLVLANRDGRGIKVEDNVSTTQPTTDKHSLIASGMKKEVDLKAADTWDATKTDNILNSKNTFADVKMAHGTQDAVIFGDGINKAQKGADGSVDLKNLTFTKNGALNLEKSSLAAGEIAGIREKATSTLKDDLTKAIKDTILDKSALQGQDISTIHAAAKTALTSIANAKDLKEISDALTTLDTAAADLDTVSGAGNLAAFQKAMASNVKTYVDTVSVGVTDAKTLTTGAAANTPAKTVLDAATALETATGTAKTGLTNATAATAFAAIATYATAEETYDTALTNGNVPTPSDEMKKAGAAYATLKAQTTADGAAAAIDDLTKALDKVVSAAGGSTMDSRAAQDGMLAHSLKQFVSGLKVGLTEGNKEGMAGIVGLTVENSTNFGRLSLSSTNGRDIQVNVTDANGYTTNSAVGYDKNVAEKTVSLRETNSTIDRDTADAMGFNSEEWQATDRGDNENGYPAGVMTLKGAQAMMNIAEAAAKALQAVRSDLGSVQNQLVATVNNISVTQVNVKAAESNIRDVDFAQESATFSKHQILAQSGVYAMSQANAVQQNVMRLLQ